MEVLERIWDNINLPYRLPKNLLWTSYEILLRLVANLLCLIWRTPSAEQHHMLVSDWPWPSTATSTREIVAAGEKLIEEVAIIRDRGCVVEHRCPPVEGANNDIFGYLMFAGQANRCPVRFSRSAELADVFCVC